MITDDQAERAVAFIRDNAKHYAKAKGERIYLEEFRKTQKALLVQQVDGTVLDRESHAYAHADYRQILEGLREAVTAEETLRWQMVAAQAMVETWRTQQATFRAQDRAHQ